MRQFFGKKPPKVEGERLDIGRPHLAELLGDLKQESEGAEVWIADVAPVQQATDDELRQAIHCHLRLANEGKRLALKNVASRFADTLRETRLNRMIEIRNVLPSPSARVEAS